MNIKTLQHSSVSPPSLPCTLVTGASSGIGWELACQLADAGVRVIALGRNEERLQALQACRPGLYTVVADLQDVSGLSGLVAQLVARHPDLACIIHNAGVQDQVRMDDAGYGAQHIQQEVNINLVAPMVLTQALLPHLQSRRAARVVNITSCLAFAPKRNAAVYSATKAGLHLFTQALRVQLQGSPVRVVEAVMPLVDTPMTAGRGRDKLSPAEAARQIIAGLQTGEAEIWVGRARAVPYLRRWAPRLLSHIMQSN